MTSTEQATNGPLLAFGQQSSPPASGYWRAELVMKARPALTLDDVQTRRRYPLEHKPAA